LQRVAITEKYRPILEKKAKENMSKGGKNFSPKKGCSNLTELPNPPINTKDQLAKIAGVSTGTY
jgi:hypothetical protein